MNIFEFRHSKAGMTLVEMVISLCILGILMTSTMGMIISSNNIFISTSKAALDRQVGNSIFRAVSSVLRYSTDLIITDNAQTDKSYNKYQSFAIRDINNISQTTHVDSGALCYRRAGTTDAASSYFSFYDNSFYGGRTVEYIIKDVKDKKKKNVKVTVNVYRDNKKVYSKTEVVKCISLSIIKTGIGKNALADSSSDTSTNQYLYFTVDENKIPGGSVAYGIESKINAYMNSYNNILERYYGYLNTVENYYESKIDGASGTLLKDDADDIADFRNTAVFGPGAEQNVDGKTYATVNMNWVNIRSHFQKEIKDLLQFTPTAAYTTYADSDTAGNNPIRAKSVTVTKDTLTATSENPYFGVVATKEELYMGFLLKYYGEDKNKDGYNDYLDRNLYPTFDSEGYFDGSIFDDMLTNGNKMVIMAYFFDGLYNDYSSLFTIQKDDLTKKSEDGNTTSFVKKGLHTISVATEGIGAATLGGKNYTKSVSVDSNKYITFACNSSASSTLSGNSYYYISNGTSTKDERATQKSGTVYKAFELVNYNGKIYSYDVVTRNTILSYVTETDNIRKVGTFTRKISSEAYTSFLENLSPLPTCLFYNKDSYYATPSIASESSYLANTTLTLTATANLPEGWYTFLWRSKDNGGTKERYQTTVTFYLDDANTLVKPNAGKTAFVDTTDANTLTAGSVNDSETTAAERKYAVLKGDKITITFTNGLASSVKYDQAQYTNAEGLGRTSWTVSNWNINQHKYSSCAIYSVDWNGWFKETTEGIFNSVIGSVSNWITRNGKTDIQSFNCAGQYPTDPTLSLGQVGKTDIDKLDGQLHSYEAALIVYNPNRGCWFYLPNTSTTLSRLFSSWSWSSVNNRPIAIDITGYATADDLYHDIDTNQYSSFRSLGPTLKSLLQSILGKSLTDEAVNAFTEDMVWSMLPVGGAIDRQQILDDLNQ